MISCKISIILPCYNVATYIERSINSVLNQTFKDYEIIVINDGSKDNLEEVCRQWADIPNFFFFTFPNQGPSQARNEGIAKSSGKYLYFFDPDDYIESDALSTMYHACEKNNCDAVQFAYRAIDESGNPTWTSTGNKEARLYESNEEILSVFLPRFIGYSIDMVKFYGSSDFYNDKEMCSVWRFLYKKELIDKYNLCYPKGVKLREDKIFNCRFFCYASKIVVIKDVLYDYYLKDSGLMYSSLLNPKSLVKDKIDGAVEREKIRELYKAVHHKDIARLYAGSLVLSAFELIVKLCKTGGGKIYRWMERDFPLSFLERSEGSFPEYPLQELTVKGKIAIASY